MSARAIAKAAGPTTRHKHHRMVSPPLWKIPGINMIQRKPPTTLPKDKIDRWNLFVGDEVMVMSGRARKDKDPTGKIVRIDRNNNLVYVQGKRLLHKHVPQSQFQNAENGKVDFEAGIHVSNVALVDPTSKNPVKVFWKIEQDAATGKLVRKRFGRMKSADPNNDTKIELEVPKPAFDPSIIEKNRIKDNKIDTLQDAVLQQTYVPTMEESPLPEGIRLARTGLW